MYMDWNCELLEHTGKFKEIHKLTSHDAVIQKAVTSCIEQQPFPRFDYETYLEKYPDVLRKWCNYKGNQKRPFPGVSELRVLEHFIIHGRKENRTAFCKNSSLHFTGFDIKEYKKVCHEAHIAKINNESWGYNHFVNRCPNAKYVHIYENNIFEERHKNMKWLQFLRNVWNSFQPWSYVVTHKINNKDVMKMQSQHKNIIANFVSFVKENIKKTAAQPKMNPTIENISLFEIKGSSILMCSHSNLNVTAGDTIMMSNYMNTLMKNNNKITLVTPFECGEIFTRNLEYKNYTIVKTNELIKTIDSFAQKMDFLFVRNHQILDKFIGKSYLQKTFFYGLDVHLEGIVKMNNQFLGVITQSEKIKEMYIKKGIVNEKIQIVEPFSYKYDFQLPERKDNEIRLIYCGTLRDEENILEIIEEFQKIHKERPEVVLKIVYGKINGNTEFTQKVNHYIKQGVKGITFKHNLSHKDSCYEIATSDIGICWRKNGWGDNGEVSTKVKEYELYGLLLIDNIYDIFSLDTVYFLYGSKFLNPKKKLSYITNNININNLIPFKCKKIEDVIDINIETIIKKSDSEILDNYNGTFKLQINELLNKYDNKLQKRIINKYQYGHIDSFINIIHNAKEKNLSELIIFEDDVLFHNNVKKLLLNFNNIKKNADIIYFGASKHKHYFVDNSQYKCKNITGTFAIFFKNNVFDDYLELLNLNLLPSDICLLILQEKYKTYVYEPNLIISDLSNSSIIHRNDTNQLYKQFNWNLNNYISYHSHEYILIVLPTFNRSENIENIINMINKQTYKYYHLLIIDDGSNHNHKETLNNIKHKYKENKNIIFKENEKNLNIANTLNKGLQFLKDDKTDKYSFFTWISDDNIYHDNFLEKLINNNNYFKYSSFNLVNKLNNVTKKVNIKYNIENLITDFKGCSSFMWSKEAILQIGFYNTNINGCEDWEYLIRTFKSNRFQYDYEDDSLMNYIRHNDSLYVKENENIIKLKNNIVKIWNFLNNDKANIVYYSKTNYKILFQRPQQIMRFFDKTFNKVFIGNIENVEVDEKYGLLIVPYHIKDCVFNFINNNDKYLYFTDSRLYNEITDKSEYKKIYDLIDAPIGEFEVWKPNLEKCVKNSDYVIYSHPKLVDLLNEIDNTKQYTYISNACDYEHFSSAKDRIGERPTDFPQTDKPILGYYGAFSEWLDFDIIRKYADEGNYHIVMIGGIQGNVRYNMKFEHKNITWLDHKPYDELPYYLSWFDKCFLPFKDCELTKYVNPCKLWEYMASGKEIIRYNVNMNVNEIVTYDIVCKKMINIIPILKINYGKFISLSPEIINYIKCTTKYFIVAPFPYKERLFEGYVKRIKYIFDIINTKYKNISFIFISPNNNSPIINCIDSQLSEIIINKKFNPNDLLDIINNKKVHIETMHGCEYFYNHNILDKINYTLDIHGAAPEEEQELNGKGYIYWNKIEYEAIKFCKQIISVSNNLTEHLEKKHNISIKNKTLTIGVSTINFDNDYFKNHEFNSNTKYNIVYSGGTQKWQNVNYIIDNLLGNSKFKFSFFTHDKIKLSNYLKKINKLQYVSKIQSFDNIDELNNNYKLNMFGFLLRNESVINYVSSPTKLCDYIINNLVPVLFRNNLCIGDYIGIKYVDTDFILNNNELTSEEYSSIIEHNKQILLNLTNLYKNNIEKFLCTL